MSANPLVSGDVLECLTPCYCFKLSLFFVFLSDYLSFSNCVNIEHAILTRVLGRLRDSVFKFISVLKCQNLGRHKFKVKLYI